MALSFSVAALMLVANPAAQAITRAHVDLMNDGIDASGGPVQAGLGGNFGVSSNRQMGCRFGAGQGLSVAGAMPTPACTVVFSFAFTDLTGFRRLSV